jgi:hypothetical protein
LIVYKEINRPELVVGEGRFGISESQIGFGFWQGKWVRKDRGLERDRDGIVPELIGIPGQSLVGELIHSGNDSGSQLLYNLFLGLVLKLARLIFQLLNRGVIHLRRGP